jgi:hypothetical protein
MIYISLRLLSVKTWANHAAKFFRRALQRLSGAAIAYGARPKDLADLGNMKLRGLAGKEYAEALKNFSTAEATRIETLAAERGMGFRLRKQEAETRMAELNTLEAELALTQKLNEIGISLRMNESGKLTLLPTPQPVSFLNDIDVQLPGSRELRRLAMRVSAEKAVERGGTSSSGQDKPPKHPKKKIPSKEQR